MSTLYDIYKQQGKALPSTVEARFADPKFAAAAQQAGITQDQYRINSGNAAMNNRIASLYGRQPTQQPTQPIQQVQPVQQPQNTQQNTMVNTPVGELFSYTPQQFNNPELDQFYNQYKQDAMQTIDEEAIKQQKLQQVQANIDALRQVYAQKLRETQRQGQNRLGQSSAIQARSGMLGSDFGAAQTSEIGQFNADIENSVRMEEQAAIEALKAQAEDRASQVIREKRAAKEAGAEKYIEYLKTATQRKEEGKRNLVQDLILKGIDPRRLDSGSLQSILNGYGITQDALFSLFDTEKIKSDQASAQAQAEADAKARRENIELGKIEMETKLMRDKFEEDKRRFGLEYALKQRTLNQKSGGGSSGVVGSDFATVSQNVSQEARNIFDLINKGQNMDDLIKGSSISAQKLRNEVNALLVAQGGYSETAKQLFRDGLAVAKSMIDEKDYNKLGGYSAALGGQLTPGYGDAKQRADQLISIIAKDSLGLMTGVLTDRDIEFLKSMSTGFSGQGLVSETFVKNKIEDIQKKLQDRLGIDEQTGNNQNNEQEVKKLSDEELEAIANQ